MAAKKPSVADAVKDLAAQRKGKTQLKTTNVGHVYEKLNNKKEIKRPKGRGGARPGAGRPPGGMSQQRRVRRQMMEDALDELVMVRVKDPKNGQEVVTKQTPITVQIKRLFQISGNGEGNVQAIVAWLDRAVGKAAQPIVGDEDEAPVQVALGVDRLLEKAYGDSAE